MLQTFDNCLTSLDFAFERRGIAFEIFEASLLSAILRLLIFVLPIDG